MTLFSNLKAIFQTRWSVFLVLFALLIILSSVAARVSNVSAEVIIFQGDKYQFKRTYTVNNPGGVQSNYDLLFEIDTATLIAAGSMQSDCGDIRFSDSVGTKLSYWIESGCNTATTQVWAEIPSLTAGDNIVYMYYGNATVANDTLSWGT